MAELASNSLAFSAYEQQYLYTDDHTTSPIQHGNTKHEPNPRDRDSGVFLSDAEDSLPPSRQPSVSKTQHTPSTKPTTPLQRSDSTLTERRLRRPADLNLGNQSAPDPAKPKSELQLRYDLIRNSSTQSRAALVSPTQLMRDRLNLSPKKEKHDVIRIFTPPRPMLNGCILPGPAAQLSAFTGKDVRAKTEKGRPAWWCKADKVVIFDGLESTQDQDQDQDYEIKFLTRTSKGLSVARRRGDCETILIPLTCSHCRDMLHRREWKYEVQVCRRSVCWECRERCRWEMEVVKEEGVGGVVDGDGEGGDEGSRERADSVLQDRQEEEELMRKVGMEVPLLSPYEAVGGIEERLEGEVGECGV